MNGHEIQKALEVWTLQSLLNVSILLGILATGLSLIQGYLRAMEKQLTLRVSVELWKLASTLAVDLLLVGVVLVGYLVLNPDIMADIKVAVPFQPIATLFYAGALVLRIFKGGHDQKSPNAFRALCLMLAGTAVNIIGFTFVMEAASGEYLALHPGTGWEYLKAHFRSNADPRGLELAQITFWVCFPLLILLLAWGVQAALRRFRADSAD